MKFVKRPAVIKNVLAFCLLSLFYLSVVKSIQAGVSALDLARFLEFLKIEKYLVGFSLITVFSVFRGWRSSTLLFFLYCLTVVSHSFSLFFYDFHKVVLLLNFFYSIISYNLFLFLRLELNEPFYNPMFPKNIMPQFNFESLPVVIKQEARTTEAFLTNWGETGFFCRLIDGERPMKGSVEIEITFKGHTFFAKGVVLTTTEKGLGVRVTSSPVPDLGWPEYYGIINELGFRPSLG